MKWFASTSKSGRPAWSSRKAIASGSTSSLATAWAAFPIRTTARTTTPEPTCSTPEEAAPRTCCFRSFRRKRVDDFGTSGRKPVPRCFLAFILAFAAPLALAKGASPANPADSGNGQVLAGKVVLAEGDARVSDARGQTRTPKLGDPIYKGDRIVTGADGEVHFDMEDGGYIGVRPNTSMSIEDFKAEGGPDDRSVLNLLQGSFRSITGWIARGNRQNYAVRTPTATIGVRGTEHEPLVIPEGSREGEPGTYDRVHNGETEIRTPQGTVGVKANQAGVGPRRGAVRPPVLDRGPGVFRTNRNDGRFQGLPDRLHQRLQQRPQARPQPGGQRRQEAP